MLALSENEKYRLKCMYGAAIKIYMDTPLELNQKGFEALIAALGYADAVRFIKQFDTGTGDYTNDRHRWLDAFSLDDIWADIKQQQVVEE